MKLGIFRATILLAGMLSLGAAQAEFPNGPITLVIPFPPGAASDVIARSISQAASLKLGQPIIVENKAGGDGIISAASVARAEPNGYRLLFGTNSALSASPALKASLPYDPLTSFAPITEIGRYTFFLYANSSVGAGTVADLVSAAKTKPDTLNYATGNTTSIVSMLQFQAITGISMSHIPYRGEPAAMLDLLNDQVQVMFANPSIGISHLQSGKIKALATTSVKRSPLLPQLPTMEEAGVKGFSITSWAGLFAPAGTPEPTLAKIREAFTAAMKEPSVQKVLDQQGFVATPSDAASLDRLVREQLIKYRDTIRAAGIQAE